MMYQLKRYERRIIKKTGNFVHTMGTRALALVQRLRRIARQPYTLVFIQHSGKKFRNFHFSFFSLSCIFIIQLALIGTLIGQSLSSRNARKTMVDMDMKMNVIQGDLDQLQDESAELFREVMDFETALAGLDMAPGTVPVLSKDRYSQAAIKAEKNQELYYYETNSIRQFKDYISSVIRQAADLRSVLDSQDAIIREIPGIWPIKGGIGHISTTFGPNLHPYTGKHYLHRGLDFSTYRQGDPIVATADGQVVTAEFDPVNGLGNYIIIRHKHGYYTRYGHMSSFQAKIGQHVQQGEVIGYIGNTGLSTGPHLHYEIHVGSDVVDPQKFIYLRSGPPSGPLLAQIP